MRGHYIPNVTRLHYKMCSILSYPYQLQKMADPVKRVNPLFLREDSLRLGIDLLVTAILSCEQKILPQLRQHGLSVAQHRALQMLARHSGLASGELATLLGIRKQAVQRIVAELVASGLVTVQIDANDRRRRLLYLTKAGKDCESVIFAALRNLVACAYQSAGADSVEGHHQVLRAIAVQRKKGGTSE